MMAQKVISSVAFTLFLLVVRCETALFPEDSTETRNLTDGEVLVIQNHNHVVIASDEKTKAELSEIQGKLDLMNKTNAELQKEVQTLRQEILQMQNSGYAFLFPRKGLSDYVINRGMPSLTQVTACFWMKSADTGNEGTLLSYSAAGTHNELLLLDYRKLSLYLGDEGRSTHVAANDGKWHHICVTWENTAGSWKLFRDGQVAATGQDFKKGHVIRAGGTLVLGQDQDSAGGTFQMYQSFIGELTDVNIWNHVLYDEVIARMSKSCFAGEGNVFKWSDFKLHTRGGVQLITPTCKV